MKYLVERNFFKKKIDKEFITDNKEKFKIFFQNLKNTFSNNKEIKTLLLKYKQDKKLSTEEKLILKKILSDNLKLIGIGSITAITFPIPMSTLLIAFLIKNAKKLGIDIIPSEFKKDVETKNVE